MMNWRRGLIILMLTELFWFCSFVIHEAIHSLSFLVMSGKVGEMHFFDAVSQSYGTIAVCLPPTGLVITNHIHLEIIAYVMQLLCTAIFGLILWKKSYPSKKTKYFKKNNLFI